MLESGRYFASTILHLDLCYPPQVRSGERRNALESELEKKVLRMEAEQEAILTYLGEELDAACHSLARNGEDKLQVFNFITLYFILFYYVCCLCVLKLHLTIFGLYGVAKLQSKLTETQC